MCTPMMHFTCPIDTVRHSGVTCGVYERHFPFFLWLELMRGILTSQASQHRLSDRLTGRAPLSPLTPLNNSRVACEQRHRSINM